MQNDTTAIQQRTAYMIYYCTALATCTSMHDAVAALFSSACILLYRFLKNSTADTAVSIAKNVKIDDGMSRVLQVSGINLFSATMKMMPNI